MLFLALVLLILLKSNSLKIELMGNQRDFVSSHWDQNLVCECAWKDFLKRNYMGNVLLLHFQQKLLSISLRRSLRRVLLLLLIPDLVMHTPTNILIHHV